MRDGCGVLQFVEAGQEDEPVLQDWRDVHNVIIPTAPLSFAQVRANAALYRLTVAYLDGELVGCSTVRPPDDETPAVTVIARILPAFRRVGYGTALHEHALTHARTLGVTDVETIVLASNLDGLAVAERWGYKEIERDLLPGDTIPFVILRRAMQASANPQAPDRDL